MIPGMSSGHDGAREDVVHCDQCSILIRVDYDRNFMVDGAEVCEDCVQMCEYCCEYLTDERAQQFGKTTTIRLWESDGRKSSMHGSCAASTLLGVWSGDKDFDADYASRSQIDAAVAAGWGVRL